MDCAECDRLKTERRLRERVYADAAASAVVMNSDPGNHSQLYLRLRVLVDLAKSDFERADVELRRHRDVHKKKAEEATRYAPGL